MALIGSIKPVFLGLPVFVLYFSSAYSSAFLLSQSFFSFLIYTVTSTFPSLLSSEIFRMDAPLLWANFWGTNLGDMSRFIYTPSADGKPHFSLSERAVMADSTTAL